MTSKVGESCIWCSIPPLSSYAKMLDTSQQLRIKLIALLKTIECPSARSKTYAQAYKIKHPELIEPEDFKHIFYAGLINKKIHNLLLKGADVQENEWAEIHNNCSSETIRLAHTLYNPKKECNMICCQLDYVEKAQSKKNSPLALIKAIKNNESEAYIIALLDQLSYVDLDTTMMGLKHATDQIVRALYEKFKKHPDFALCDKSCLANHLFNRLGYPLQRRCPDLVKEILQDISYIRKTPCDLKNNCHALNMAISHRYSDEIVKMVMQKAVHFEPNKVLYRFNNNKISDKILKELLIKINDRDMPRWVLSSEIYDNNKNEEWLFKLLKYTKLGSITPDMFSRAIKNGYSAKFISALVENTLPAGFKKYPIDPDHFLHAHKQGYLSAVEKWIPQCAPLEKWHKFNFILEGFPQKLMPVSACRYRDTYYHPSQISKLHNVIK